MSGPFVIVGAGHAARRAAETLRQLNPEASIRMIGDEPHVPYDRPVLSKQALQAADDESKAFIRDEAFYVEQRIELSLGARVVSIDRATRQVKLSDGSSVPYGTLLLATGSRVRHFPGSVDPGAPVYYLRTLAETRELRKVLLPGRKVVVIGGGFIGLEVAASSVQMGAKVCVIEPAARLLQRTMPAAIGDFVQSLHASHGVKLRLQTTPSAIRLTDQGGAVVETDQGPESADLVVVGIGVVPNVELARDAGLEVDNGIVVDDACRTSDASIFAAGEVTSHFNALLGKRVRIESWQVAENQPVVAAASMSGQPGTYAEQPWLWSDQYDCNLQTLGLFAPELHMIQRGDPASGRFSMLGLSSDNILQAVAAVNNGRDVSACRRLMAAGKPLDAARLGDLAVPLR
jgi:anthranilate 1,2-dioxygenase ferredoxin reductase subunit